MIKTVATTITLLVLLIFLVNISFGQQSEQKSYSKQFSIVTDNDFYLLRKKDGYYTNGFILKYSSASKRQKPGIAKRISNFELGHLMFMQGDRKIQDVALIDRPITGYLYGRFSQLKFLNSDRFYELGASVGTIGEAAKGRNMQNFYHRQISVNSSHWGWVWNYQLKSEAGVNLHGSYGAPLIKKTKPSFQVTPQINATLGTTFTNITPGVLIQAGKFNSASESSYWGSAISRNAPMNNDAEFFVFYHPRFMYQAFNATVQGGMFTDDKGPITSSLEAFVFSQEAGVVLSKSKYLFSYTVTYQTREAKSQRSNHAYGRIQLAYRFN